MSCYAHPTVGKTLDDTAICVSVCLFHAHSSKTVHFRSMVTEEHLIHAVVGLHARTPNAFIESESRLV